MAYTFQFGVIVTNASVLLVGIAGTLAFSLVGVVVGLLLALVLAFAQALSRRMTRILIQSYVEIVRNTPFLLQLFIIYFGLPSVGVRLSPNLSAALAITLNAAAYLTDIIRVGIAATGKGQIEAARALGLTRLQTAYLAILSPALASVYPAICSQLILVMLGTSVISVVSAQELTYYTAIIQGRTFRSFELYIAAGVIYLLITNIMQLVFYAIGRFVFPYASTMRAVK